MKYNKSRIAFCQACSNEAHGVKTRIAVEHTCSIAVPVSEVAKVEEEYTEKENEILNKWTGEQRMQLAANRNKPFFIDRVRTMLKLFDQGKISFSRFVELLNIDAVEFAMKQQSPSPVILTESLAGEIWDAARRYLDAYVHGYLDKSPHPDKKTYIKSLNIKQ